MPSQGGAYLESPLRRHGEIHSTPSSVEKLENLPSCQSYLVPLVVCSKYRARTLLDPRYGPMKAIKLGSPRLQSPPAMLARGSRWALLLLSSGILFAQSAQLSGLVLDPTGASVANARLELRHRDTGVRRETLTNGEGFYSFLSLKAGTYQATLQVENFRTVTRESITLDVGDRASLDFNLQLANTGEHITVTSDHAIVNPLDPAVSTVVDQEVVQNMPLNGRSFQSLIALSPGVVFTPTDLGLGQFSVNGQRSTSNYFMVDGVSANFGSVYVGTFDQGLGGVTPGLTLDGGTNSLLSVDAMQEFRIQTSTYAPEFGRTPGASISILTKSGTNQFHGTAFDYWRNDLFDARNFFNTEPQPKPPLRQNDFGGTLGGPIVKNKTFFFFSYEGLRLRLPKTDSALFYTQSARVGVAPAYRPFINALPLPTGPVIDTRCDNIKVPCIAPLTDVYSNPSSVDATSLRVDHSLGAKMLLFARYNHSPSQSTGRYFNQISTGVVNIDTLTIGATSLFSGALVNEFRANWSRYLNGRKASYLTDSYGAVVPTESELLPSPLEPVPSSAFVFFPDILENVGIFRSSQSLQRQLNFLDTLGWSSGTHQVKIGIDYRALRSSTGPINRWTVFPDTYESLFAGTADYLILNGSEAMSIGTQNYSVFGQDTWRISDRLTLTYGLRWEINTPPVSTMPGSPLYTVQGIFDTRQIAFAPGSLWHTRYGNFAPRAGGAYQATPTLVIRGGFGLFYDLGYGNVGNIGNEFPYRRTKTIVDSTLPFNSATEAFRIPPFSTRLDSVVSSNITAVDPNLGLPYTLHWNTALEIRLGARQTLTATYVGANGRRLIRADEIRRSNLNAPGANVDFLAMHNGSRSRYNALQVQLQRRMSRGLQALLSYNLAKASDTGSNDRFGSGSKAASLSEIEPPALGPSDFDIRHSLAGAVSYEMPLLCGGAIRKAMLQGWALDGLLRVSSPPPINVTIGAISPVIGRHAIQPDIVRGQPYWIADASQPGGKALNPAAFARPAAGTVGNFPRNGLRSSYSINQLDVALRRRFNLTERLKLDVRVEYFNVFNHPMFGAPGAGSAPFSFLGYGSTPSSLFGKISPGLTTNVAVRSQNPLYAVGGPRSGQFTLKLHF